MTDYKLRIGEENDVLRIFNPGQILQFDCMESEKTRKYGVRVFRGEGATTESLFSIECAFDSAEAAIDHLRNLVWYVCLKKNRILAPKDIALINYVVRCLKANGETWPPFQWR
jgi:hypothetical protein